MKMFLVQPKPNKLSAYHFDGTRESALPVVDKWGCVMSMVGDNLYKITLTDGRDVMPNDYVILDGADKRIYKQEEFVRRYDIVYDSRQYNNYNTLNNFMSDDWLEDWCIKIYL